MVAHRLNLRLFKAFRGILKKTENKGQNKLKKITRPENPRLYNNLLQNLDCWGSEGSLVHIQGIHRFELREKVL